MSQQREIYCFISDEAKKFYRATQQSSGSYMISFDSQPMPIRYNPSNLLKSQMEFATNQKYNSMVRNVLNPLDFIKDGAAILRHFYFLGKGTQHKCYLTIIEWNGVTGVYELSYYGRIDLGQKNEDPKAGIFTVPCVDDSAWGILSQNDEVEYAIDCNFRNPKAIRVLIDGTTLLNRYTYQPTATSWTFDYGNTDAISIVLVNQDGDSSGVVAKGQQGQRIPNADVANFLSTSSNYYFSSYYPIVKNIAGSISFESNNISNGNKRVAIHFEICTSVTGPNGIVIVPIFEPDVDGKIWKFDFNLDVPLSADEKCFIILYSAGLPESHLTLNYITTNIFVSTRTVSQPVVAYGLRPLDLVNQLVAKATNNRFSINSDYFTVNNKSIILSGDSIRGLPNAKIYSSFGDFFKTFNSILFLALKDVNGSLYIEKFIDVYNQTTGNIITLGECIDLKLQPAIEWYCNQIVIGSPKQDYRHPSGRLEFNSENIFSLNIQNVNKTKELVTSYRLGCYDIIFLILDYKGQSSQDNTGDKSNYVVQITDQQATAVEDIETFENFTVNNAPLAPIIKSPYDNDTVNYNKPTIKGISKPGDTVNIYVDTILDGSCVADGNGNWTYNIVAALTPYNPGIETGLHVVDATFTDLSAPVTTVNLFIDTSVATPLSINYPMVGDNLYNNKPLFKGIADHGTNINVTLDGILLGSVVTDNSGKWSFKSTVIVNGNHNLDINGLVVNFNVDSNVDHPLITYIGSELDGVVIINNLPLIEGVAKAGTLVELWLNYITYQMLGTTVADANGAWSFQAIPVTYTDPLSGIPVILAPIRNGVNVVSTSLINYTVGVVVTGYKLSRPAYSSITGVIDNTVFNTEFSPKRMLNNWNPLWAAILKQQPNENIYFQKADKNGDLRTVLGGVAIAENDDVPTSSLGTPLGLLEYGLIKTKTNSSFAKTLKNFINGGLIQVTFRGNDLLFLPIGSMKIDNIASDVQEWKILMANSNTYQTLLNLYKNGLTINLMTNAIYHSDYNTLHFVTYNFQQPNKYNFKSHYDDWFNNRNDAWLLNPDYIQKIQQDQPFVDQIITNGVSGITLKFYNCIDGSLAYTIPYNAVGSPPIPPPYIVLEAVIDTTTFAEGQYFPVLWVSDTPVAIGERFEIKDKWLGTILIEASSSINQVGAFFSTGFKSIIRVEGLVKKLQPDIISNVANEESGDKEMLYSQISRKRTIRFGTAYGLPDYLYLKVASALLLDNLQIEGVYYVLAQDEKINPSEDVPGHPLYYYDVNLTLKTNTKGLTAPGAPGADIDSTILVVDATAFGLPAGSLINIHLD